MAEEAAGTESTISDDIQLDELREGIDDPTVLKAQLQKEAEARRQLTARAKRAEEQAKTEREARIRLEEESRKDLKDIITNKPAFQEDDRFELRMSGYSKSDVDFIMANGGPKVLEDPTHLVSIAVKSRREQLEAEKAASQTSSSGLADVERQINFNLPKNPSIKDLKGSIEAMEKVLPHAE